MEAISETPPPDPTGDGPMLATATGEELDVMRLAETFAVTPEAARLAVARVGTDIRDLQRELGGRR